MGFKIYQILWEALSVLLLLYGVYLLYAFMWFSASEILKIDVSTAKFISAVIAIGIIAYSTFKWFKKKKEELKKLEEQEGN
jgi:TRAP-type C4-dicarboxylate transport system permease large subunit